MDLTALCLAPRAGPAVIYSLMILRYKDNHSDSPFQQPFSSALFSLHWTREKQLLGFLGIMLIVISSSALQQMCGLHPTCPFQASVCVHHLPCNYRKLRCPPSLGNCPQLTAASPHRFLPVLL